MAELDDEDSTTGVTTSRDRFAILVGPDGERLDVGPFTLSAGREWTSMRTFNTYPISWRLEIPGIGLRLDLQAATAPQECIAVLAVSFWEGRVSVKGTWSGREVGGLGFVEVVPAQRFNRIKSFLDRPGAEVRRQLHRLYPDTLDRGTARDFLGVDLPDAPTEVPLTDLHAGLVKPVRHLVDSGGKCWRPFLLMVAIELAGGEAEPFRDLMAAAELVHVGSLIVDDVEDRSPVRRGGPSVHSIYGEATAINAGTAAYFVFDRLLRTLPDLDAPTTLRVYQLFCETLRAAHAGQALDILGHDEAMWHAMATNDASHIEQRVLEVHRLKTGMPARGLAEIGAVLAHAAPPVVRGLGCYFGAVGQAYQICDDVLDLRGHLCAGTRSPGEDLRNAKVTLPLALAVALLPPAEIKELWHGIHRGNADQETVRQCIQALEQCGAVEQSLAFAEAVVDRAWTQLEPLIEPSYSGIVARALGWYAASRDSVLSRVEL